MAEPTVFLEHRITGARYVYCPILASHPDIVQVIVDDEVESTLEAKPAPTRKKAAKPAPVQDVVVVEDVVDVVAEQDPTFMDD